MTIASQLFLLAPMVIFTGAQTLVNGTEFNVTDAIVDLGDWNMTLLNLTGYNVSMVSAAECLAATDELYMQQNIDPEVLAMDYYDSVVNACVSEVAGENCIVEFKDDGFGFMIDICELDEVRYWSGECASVGGQYCDAHIKMKLAVDTTGDFFSFINEYFDIFPSSVYKVDGEIDCLGLCVSPTCEPQDVHDLLNQFYNYNAEDLMQISGVGSALMGSGIDSSMMRQTNLDMEMTVTCGDTMTSRRI